VHIASPAREFAAIIRHSGMTQVLNIDISDGTKALALPKAIQRDPVRDTYDHVDLLVVRAGEKITIEVPVVLVGEAARDTLVNHDQQSISIIADATKLPEHIEASIEGLQAGSHVTAGDLKLPAGVELAADPELIVVIVNNAPSAADLEAEGGETEGVETEAAGETAEQGDEAA
jgi:large subunit ribosomal protein L25